MDLLKRHGKRIVLEGLGWILILAGLAALVLPGPGLLLLVAGLALLATQYEWAERRLEPVQKAALKGAADSVKTWPRILVSISGGLLIIALGILWGIHPAVPSWWPIAEKWWLIGDWGTGIPLMISGVIAIATIMYSYRKFRPAEVKHKQ